MRMREKICLIKRESVIKLIGFIVFMAILVKVFSNVTYMFRNVGYNRNHIVEIKGEKLDMVYIGGSAAFVYWQPLKAWNDCGFTSYLYATDTIQAENIQAFVEEVRKEQNPDLFVIDVRPFQYYSDEEVEFGFRNGSDGMDLTSSARYKSINEYFKNRIFLDNTNYLSYYLDIIKYHTNTGNLGASEAWKLSNNTGGVSSNKGWEWIDLYMYLEEPEILNTKLNGALIPNCKNILVKLLDYCKQENLTVLFVVCPYQISIEDQKKYNTVGDIIQDNGFDYLNTNLYYEEIGIDFSTDFYNKDHVNLFGAEKYTTFLEQYILDNYAMPDHRDDEAYESWNENYKQFLKEKEIHSDIVTNMHIEAEKGLEIAMQMSQTDSLFEWIDLTEDDRFTILVTANENMEWQSVADQKLLEKWGFSKADGGGIRVITNGDILYKNEYGENELADGKLGVWLDHFYYISIENNTSSIIVDGKEYSLNHKGMNIVVYDNNYGKVIQSVAIDNENNKLIMIKYREE